MPVYLFPGQGSQQPGAALPFAAECTAAQTVLDTTRALTPTEVFRCICEGPQEQLNHTSNAQPALLCAEMAAVAWLSAADIRPQCCAGHSLGEISALVAAGALSYAQALPLVCERARLMSEHVPEGGMAAVLGLAPAHIEAALPEDAEIANYNGPGQTIISGSTAALAKAEPILKEAGAKRILPLPVSGPFHSRHMEGAAAALAVYLEGVDIAPPEIPFVSSVTGDYETAPAHIKLLLAEQLCRPVRWTDVMQRLAATPALEVGPGTVLKGLARRTPEAPRVFSAGTPDACRQALQEIEDAEAFQKGR